MKIMLSEDPSFLIQLWLLDYSIIIIIFFLKKTFGILWHPVWFVCAKNTTSKMHWFHIVTIFYLFCRDEMVKARFLYGHLETVAALKILATVMAMLTVSIHCLSHLHQNVAQNLGILRSVHPPLLLLTAVVHTMKNKLWVTNLMCLFFVYYTFFWKIQCLYFIL